MFSVHEFREFRMNFAWSDLFRRSLPPEAFELMQSGGDVGDQPGYDYLFSQPAQKFYDELTLFGVSHRDDLPPSNVRDIAKSMGLRMRVASALNKTGPWLDGVFFQHTQDAEWKRFAKDTRSELVLPIMANSVSLGRTLQALHARFQASLAALDALGLGVFLVDATGCVIDHNKEAQRILDLQDGIYLNASKHLKLHSSGQTSELESMINNANGLFLGELKGSNSLMASRRPSEAHDYLISVLSLSDSKAELEVGLKCAFVAIIDPQRKDALSIAGITKLGQLSAAESDIVNLLVRGFRPAEVAVQRDVSVNTIKTQLKGISQKLRCSSQGDIIRIAAATNIPLNESDVHPKG
jgi:DNA-binding CsgD family transcriptional regulator